MKFNQLWNSLEVKVSKCLCFTFKTLLDIFVALDINLSKLLCAFFYNLKWVLAKYCSIFAWECAHLGLQWICKTFALPWKKSLRTPMKKSTLSTRSRLELSNKKFDNVRILWYLFAKYFLVAFQITKFDDIIFSLQVFDIFLTFLTTRSFSIYLRQLQKR